MTAPSKTYTFKTIFGKHTSKNALEKYDSVRDIPQKVEKTSGDSLGGLRGSGQLLASRGQLCQSSGSAWEVLGELGRVFFSENKPPEGAYHRQTMLLENQVSFFPENKPPGGRLTQANHACRKPGVFFPEIKTPEGAAHRQTMLL